MSIEYFENAQILKRFRCHCSRPTTQYRYFMFD